MFDYELTTVCNVDVDGVSWMRGGRCDWLFLRLILILDDIVPN